MTRWLTCSLARSETDIFSIYLLPTNQPKHQPSKPRPFDLPKEPNRANTKKSSTTRNFSQDRIVTCGCYDSEILIYPSHAFSPHFIRWTVASNMPCYYQETCLGPFAVWTTSECHSTLRYQPRNSRFPRKILKHNLQLDWLRTTLASLHVEILSHIKSVHD